MGFILELFINAGILFLLAYLLPSVRLKNYGTAIAVVLVIGILNTTVGFLLRLPLNILTLGIMTFVVKLVVTTVIIKLADKLFSGFEVDGLAPALFIALVMALAGSWLYFW